MTDRFVTAKLEQLVEGELSLAVLNGLHVLAYEALRELSEIDRDGDLLKQVVQRATKEAGRLAVPDDVPVEARADWKVAAIDAIRWFSVYSPAFEELRDDRPE